MHGACEQQQTESFQGNPALGGLGSLFPKRFVEQPQGLNHAPALCCAQRRQPNAKGSGQEQQGDAPALRGARCGKGKAKTCLKMAISRCHVCPPGAGAHLVQPVQV